MASPCCPICCEPFTDVRRKPIECHRCARAACTECCQRFLLLESSTEAECMSCRAPWPRDFLDANFSKAFVNKDFKAHREQVLFEREQALLPASQHMVEHWNRAEDLRRGYQASTETYNLIANEMARLKRRRDEMQAELRVLEGTGYQRPYRRTAAAGGGEEPERAHFVRACPAADCRGFLSSAWKCGTCSIWVCPDCHGIKGLERDAADHECHPDDVATAQLLQRDTKPCPKCASMITKIDGCFDPHTPILMYDGGIKTAKAIEIGDILVGDDGLPRTVTDTCSGNDVMYEVSQNNGHASSYVVNSKHKLVVKFSGGIPEEITVDDFLALDSSVQRTAMGIKSNGEQPSEISIRQIGRGEYVGWSIDGNMRFVLPDFTVVRNCDQMWCVQCHTAFSWRTGRQVNGTVHNPHFYEWQRRQNGGVAPRVPGDDPCDQQNQGRLPEFFYVTQRLPQDGGDIRRSLFEYHRIILHVEYVQRATYRVAEQPDNSDLRLKYLIRQIDEVEWKRRLQQREKKRLKDVAALQILEQFIAVGTEIFRLIARGEIQPAHALAQLDDLRTFANENIVATEKRFSMKIDHIPVVR